MKNLIWTYVSLNAAKNDGVIVELRGRWRFLSNFWQQPVSMYGVTFPTNEHAFAAAKDARAGTPEGTAALQAFANLTSPAEAKKRGRRVALRKDWEEQQANGLLLKELILLELVRRKFADPKMGDKLLSTNDCLILEGNTWNDKLYGVVDTPNGVTGANRLGSMLMCVRGELGGAGVPSSVPASMPRYEGKSL